MDNITSGQRELLERIEEADADLLVHWDETRGVAASIRGRLTAGGGEEALVAFLEEFGPIFGLAESSMEFLTLLSRDPDEELGWTRLLYQHFVPVSGLGRVEVYGSKIAGHINAEGALDEVQSSLWRDLRVEGEVNIDRAILADVLRRQISELDGYDRLLEEVAPDQKDFPLTAAPRMVIYPWQNRFPLAWTSYGFAADHLDIRGEPLETPQINYGHIFLDAATGEMILFSPTLRAESPATGTGLAVTPLSGTRTTRQLDVVRVDSGNTYLLKNTTHARDIITYDAMCSTSYNENDEIYNALKDGKLPVSQDTEGDHHWDTTPANTTHTQRTASQLPEVDAHYLVNQQYLWYKALGRTGWDNGEYQDPPVPNQTINVIAHCYPPSKGGNCTVYNAYKWAGVYEVETNIYRWISWLEFADGDGATWDYPAGSHFIVAHEYQHAITDFSFKDGAGNPGLDNSGWLGAVHEGLSDTFGCLSTGQWLPGRDVSHSTPGQVFRNLVYPRDNNAHDSNMFDHFDDRNNNTGMYHRGTILAHCAYLMGKGGVHQRTGRKPGLIPVYSPGQSTEKGVKMPKAARIWYRALTLHCSTLGAVAGTGDHNTFSTIRNACETAARKIFGQNSAEYCTTILAFYAVGLHPEEYGADVTFLRWGASWDLSRCYIGLSSPNYSSRDLFINNGGNSEWNALINIIDPITGQPTDYENNIYCRVRNVGDKAAVNVQVTFEYTRVGTATWKWLPVKDKAGKVQTLNLGTLAAGESNFADKDQNTPPAAAGVKWSIPPLAPGDEVDHFCLRAKVAADNDVNAFNNEVQSNIAYIPYKPATRVKTDFIVGNPQLEIKIPVELRLDHTLPEKWKAYILEDFTNVELEPGQEQRFAAIVEAAEGADKQLELPLDGDLNGRMIGEIQGSFTGTLTDTVLEGSQIRGNFAGIVGQRAAVVGLLDGTIDLRTAEIRGDVIAGHPDRSDEERIEVTIRGCLRPWRRVEISQWAEDDFIGGITIQVQVPWNNSPCPYNLPPTGTDASLREPIP